MEPHDDATKESIKPAQAQFVTIQYPLHYTVHYSTAPLLTFHDETNVGHFVAKRNAKHHDERGAFRCGNGTKHHYEDETNVNVGHFVAKRNETKRNEGLPFRYSL